MPSEDLALDAADISAFRAAPLPSARRALVVEGDAAMARGTLLPSGRMHRWFPAVVTGLQLAFQKGKLAGKTLWAQLGSNQ